ncbi:MAG: MFS transporter [Candidatus Coatesbacteria bacterium]
MPGGPAAPKAGFFNLPKNVVLLGWTSLLTDVGSEMILPILPLFLKGALGAPIAAIAFIEGVAEATANGFKLVSGGLSDRIGRSKPFVFFGYGLSTIVKPILAIAPTWHFVLGVRFADRVGKGLRTAPRDAIVAASTPKEQYGKAYGFHRSMDTTGALLGGAIAMVVMWFVTDVNSTAIRWMFAFSVVPCLAAMFFIVPVQEEAAPQPGKGLRLMFDFPAQVWLLMAGITLWELGNLSYALVLLRIYDPVVGVSAKWVPVVYFGYNLVYLVVAMPMGMLSDKFGIKAALLTSPLLGAAAFWTLGAPVPWVAVTGGIVLYALHSAAINTIPRAAVAHYATPGARGTLFGLVGACAFLGNTLAGQIWQRVDSSTAMRVAGALSLLSLIPFALLKPKQS